MGKISFAGLIASRVFWRFLGRGDPPWTRIPCQSCAMKPNFHSLKLRQVNFRTYQRNLSPSTSPHHLQTRRGGVPFRRWSRRTSTHDFVTTSNSQNALPPDPPPMKKAPLRLLAVGGLVLTFMVAIGSIRDLRCAVLGIGLAPNRRKTERPRRSRACSRTRANALRERSLALWRPVLATICAFMQAHPPPRRCGPRLSGRVLTARFRLRTLL